MVRLSLLCLALLCGVGLAAPFVPIADDGPLMAAAAPKLEPEMVADEQQLVSTWTWAQSVMEHSEDFETEEGLGAIEGHINLVQVQASLGRLKDFVRQQMDNIIFSTFALCLCLFCAYTMKQMDTTNGTNAEIQMRKSLKRILFQTSVLCIYLILGCIIYGMVEKWSCLDCVYFMAVTVTTVGYGDLLPSSEKMQLFTIFFGTFGVAVIGTAATDVAQFLMAMQMQATKEKQQKAISGALQPEDRGSLSDANRKWAETVVKASVPILFFVLIGTLLGVLVEDWTLVESFYYGTITVTTIGYGDYSPSTEFGRRVAIFYLLAAVVVVTNALSQLAMLFADTDINVDLEKMLAEDESGVITKEEFMARMLIQLNMVEGDMLANIRKQFATLDADGSGELDHKDVKLLKERYGIASAS